MRYVWLTVCRFRLFLAGVLLAVLPLPPAAAADDVFSWRQCSGQTLRVMFNRHPYSEGIRRRIEDFEELTGIRVATVTQPEERYFQDLDRALDSEYGQPDVYMTGVHQIWQYALTGKAEPLDAFVVNPALTRHGYAIADFFPSISGAFRWNGKAGSKLGDGPLWAIPIGFEMGAITYNREVLARHRYDVPATMAGLIEIGRDLRDFDGEGTFGVAVRGLGTGTSLHSGYMTVYVNHGATDMSVENGRLVSRVNSPEAVAATDLWVTMLREGGPADWEWYDWYRCLEDIGDRKAAMIYDSDILGYFANATGASSQSGKLGLALPPMPPGSDPATVTSNLWVWGLAINPASTSMNAAWLFVQYFTSREFQTYSVLEWRSVNPPRRSVFEDPAFQRQIAAMHGYAETFSALVANAAVHFTPNPHYAAINDRWAAVVRDIANGMYASTEEGMNTLKIWMDNKLADVAVD